MASFIRGKQAGIQHDLSQGVAAEFFLLDDLARYGVNSQISCLAYEPIQSLLAIGTNDSKFGSGQVYVFGQRRVCVTFAIQGRASVKEIQFCGERLVVLDNKNNISIFSLETRKRIAFYSPPGHVTALLTDPSLDYCLTGLQNGEIVAYDLDRESMTAFRIPNLWREQNPRAKMVSIVALAFHPKDIGSLLIGYTEGAVIYSFKQNKAAKLFHYTVPRGAPGGDSAPTASNHDRSPRLTHALWHPTGTFLLTAHEDTSLVFWDVRDGRILQARTIEDADVNTPGSRAAAQPMGGGIAAKQPYSRIMWCSKENPDDTGLLLGGGTAAGTMGLTFIELGLTPNYQTSSWDHLSTHFRNPKRTHVLPTPPNAAVSTFVAIPRRSPHFGGCHDPIAVIAALSSGELVTLSFPSGHPISPSNQLHVSLSMVQPFVTKFIVTPVNRTRWLGMKESRQMGPPFLLGGAESTKPMKRFEDRNIIHTAHADGTVRLWDVGCGDEIENGSVMQVDLARAVGRWDNINVTQMTMSGATGELVIGLATGEVVVFRLNRNPNVGQPPAADFENEPPGRMTSITRRADPTLKEGLLPLTLTNDQQGAVTAMRLSNIGFLASGYETGGLTVIDLRGPAIIHTCRLQDLIMKRSSSISGALKGRRTSQQPGRTPTSEHPTVIEFGIMTLEGDDYSSIAMFVGTSHGRVATFKILPSQTGRYSVSFAGSVSLSDDRIVSISPTNSHTGAPAAATGQAMAGLQQGQFVDGVLVVVTASSAHIFRPAQSKGASKSFDDVLCDAAAVTRFEQRGYALVGLFGDGTARAFSIPALKDLGIIRLNQIFDVKRFPEASITSAGDIVGWVGPSEIALASVWGANQPLPPSNDRLFDPAKLPIPRPTITSLQWIAGTQYITPADLDILIGGPDRPPSKRMIAEMRAQQEDEFNRQREAARTGRAQPPAPEQEGYWAYMQRQIQERTENLGLATDSMDRTAEASSNWSDDVSKFVAKQKRQAAMGLISSKFGF